MKAEEGDHPALVLQGGDVHVKVHAIDALQFQRDVLLDDFGNGLW